MIETYLKNHYQKCLVNPLLYRLGNRITPNQITLISGLLGILVLPVLFIGQAGFATLLLLFSGYCDTLDGTLARYTNRSTPWGSALDIMTDRLVEWVVVFALFLVAPDERGGWCMLMLGSMLLCITSFLVVGIFSVNQSQKSFHYSPGIMERAEAIFFFILMILLPDSFAFLAGLFSILVLCTAIIRLVQFYYACHPRIPTGRET